MPERNARHVSELSPTERREWALTRLKFHPIRELLIAFALVVKNDPRLAQKLREEVDRG